MRGSILVAYQYSHFRRNMPYFMGALRVVRRRQTCLATILKVKARRLQCCRSGLVLVPAFALWICPNIDFQYEYEYFATCRVYGREMRRLRICIFSSTNDFAGFFPIMLADGILACCDVMRAVQHTPSRCVSLSAFARGQLFER